MHIEVIIPVPLAQTYTYSVPAELESKIKPGCLVLVEFGRNKYYSAIVAFIHLEHIKSSFDIKDIIAVESDQPVLRRPQLKFWEWLSDYYLCKLGEVYKAVLPSGFRAESTSTYKPRTEVFIRLNPLYVRDKEALHPVFDSLKRAPKQEQLLLAYLDYSSILTEVKKREISQKELLERSRLSIAVLKGLIDKKILESYDKQVSRISHYEYDLVEPNKLNRDQTHAFNKIMTSFKEKDVCLLHGVTSAGKTEIYISVINQALLLGRQVLFLLPEIALTTQITERLQKVFGDKLGIYHSRLSDNERVEVWKNMLEKNSFQIILGVRSSIFLPFRDLGLVIVDEEHETGYKQQDPAPRYHARNAAIVLAGMHGAKVLLGSATPSIESYFNSQTGKYGYVKLDKRFEDQELPEIMLVDIKELKRKKRMKGLFSPVLKEMIERSLEEGEQVILFQNRRGFAPMIFCKICDWVPKCKYCDVSLTHHKKKNQLVCHYCGNTYVIPAVCPDCGNEDLQPRGFGTEKVEEEIKELFPGVKTARMDADTTTKKNSYEEIIQGFESGTISILIGTQMVSKGLDFSNVGLVGILNSDSMMNFPDFRAHERAYQLMAQVAGRAGRRKNRGKVILQTSNPDQPLLHFVINNNYEGMYQMQMEERSLFKYPPLYRIIELTLKNKKENVVDACAAEYAILLKQQLGIRILGPDKPLIGKIQNFYLQKIIIKIEISASLSRLHEILDDVKEKILSDHRFKYTIIQYDVDPL